MMHVAEQGMGRDPEATNIMLMVRPGNFSAHRLYERCGFRRVAVVQEYYGDADGWEMSVNLNRILARLCDRNADEEPPLAV
mmetsp:Transcript_33380/g.95409  ORF Transcript_33380/g.95409 Transcript_33380/m.95409 type:complete len:81 (-) Transcript_33380:199-441(-)